MFVYTRALGRMNVKRTKERKKRSNNKKYQQQLNWRQEMRCGNNVFRGHAFRERIVMKEENKSESIGLVLWLSVVRLVGWLVGRSVGLVGLICWLGLCWLLVCFECSQSMDGCSVRWYLLASMISNNNNSNALLAIRIIYIGSNGVYNVRIR